MAALTEVAEAASEEDSEAAEAQDLTEKKAVCFFHVITKKPL